MRVYDPQFGDGARPRRQTVDSWGIVFYYLYHTHNFQKSSNLIVDWFFLRSLFNVIQHEHNYQFCVSLDVVPRVISKWKCFYVCPFVDKNAFSPYVNLGEAELSFSNNPLFFSKRNVINCFEYMEILYLDIFIQSISYWVNVSIDLSFRSANFHLAIRANPVTSNWHCL